MTAVRIPPVLRAQAGNQKKVEVTGSTVGEALESLLEQFPGLHEQIFTDDGVFALPTTPVTTTMGVNA